MRILWAWAICIAAVSWAGAQTGAAPGTQTAAAPVEKTVEITPSQNWTDTGIDLHSGDVVELAASAAASGGKVCDPQGLVDAGNAGKLPLESALPGALLAKLQEKTGTLVFVGTERRLKVAEAGRLFLGSNLAGAAPCSGKYSIRIHLTPASTNQPLSIKSKLASAAQIWLGGQFGGANQQTPNSSAATNPESGAAGSTIAAAAAAGKMLPVSSVPLAAAFAHDLQSLPRRVSDEFKNPGDMVNFVLVGSEKQVQGALTAADWHLADTDNQGAAIQAILMATKKQDYLQMPMSQLYLFGRVQDFGYEQAEPYAMVASRHHFRIWKSPVTYNGQPVWAGAGTHDIGFEKDQRNGKITHKIDPGVDGERDNIGQSLLEAGKVKMMSYFTPSDPVLESKNATGGGFHSDGRVLVIFLQ